MLHCPKGELVDWLAVKKLRDPLGRQETVECGGHVVLSRFAEKVFQFEAFSVSVKGTGHELDKLIRVTLARRRRDAIQQKSTLDVFPIGTNY